MADTFSNDLRLRLQESGSNAGTWGDLLNDTITNIASALGQGSEVIPNASTHTITLADGTADEARSLYLKCTGGGQACTVTLGPNTISKVWIIDNATSYTLTFSQGSGANVAIAAGAVKVIATDGAGSGAAVVDTLDGLEGSLSTLAVSGALTVDTNTLVVDATNNQVGIGITPATLLDIKESTAATDAIIGLTAGTGGRAQIRSEAQADNTSSELSFYTMSGSNTSEAMRISGSNVGIGTSSPRSVTNYSVVGINGTSGSAIDFELGEALKTTFTQTAGQFEINVVPALPLIFKTSNTERLRIDGATGSVGIGTSSPRSVLDLDGGSETQLRLQTTNTGSASSDGLLISLDSSANANAYLWNYENAAMIFGTNAIERMRIDGTTGNVRIGGTSAISNPYSQMPNFADVNLDGTWGGVISFKLGGVTKGWVGQRSSGNADMVVGATAGQELLFYENNVEAMRISGGALLVGTTSSTAKLVVEGGVSSGETIRVDNSKANYAGANVYSVLFGSGTNTVSSKHFQGYADGAVRFAVAGNGAVYGNGTYGTYSDLKLKENIVDANSQWADIKAVQLKNYSMKEDSLSEANQLGVIAQDLEASGMQKLIEEMNDKDVDGNFLGTTTKHVKYSILHLKALGALQEAMERIETLEARLTALENN